jgi:sulfate adenylyltransferase (ADP) / ATP adenylyltransferase
LKNTPDDKMLYGKALWLQVNVITDSAKDCNALKATSTHCETREVTCGDKTVNIQVRVVENLIQKSENVQQRANQEPNVKDLNQKHANPFLPYEPALYVGELTDHYRCLLNKFNVIDHHILMVTSRFVPQQTPLDIEDFLAAHLCLQAQDGLVFYNGGPAAGASVEHKHLQMIPLPLTLPLTATNAFPFEGLLSSASIVDNPTETALPFTHRAIATAFTNTTSIELLTAAAEHSCKNYHRLLTDLKLSPGSDGMMPPHNMLLTRNYLWVIPRRKDNHEGLAVNALGFAGMLLVQGEKQLSQLDRIGCLELLKAVTR